MCQVSLVVKYKSKKTILALDKLSTTEYTFTIMSMMSQIHV